MKIKVAIVTPGAFTIPAERKSSVETIVEKTAEILSRHVELYVFSKFAAKHPEYEVIKGVAHHRPNIKSSSYLEQVSEQLQTIQPDLIQIENRPKFVPILKKTNPGSKLILFLHSTHYISPKQIKHTELSDCLKDTDLIFTNSRYLKKVIASGFPQYENKIQIIYPGVDPKQFISRWTARGKIRSTKVKKELRLKNRQVIMYAGRLIEQKGVHLILKAMPRLIAKHPKALLLIVGSSYYSRDAKTSYVRNLYALAKKTAGHVKFVPFIPYEKIPELYCAADVVVVPSVKEEAFGLVNVEAMASGIPVIASNVGGIKEVVKHKSTGFLIDSNKAQRQLVKQISLLFSNKKLCKQMGENAVKTVCAQFTWHHTAMRILSAYSQLAELVHSDEQSLPNSIFPPRRM